MNRPGVGLAVIIKKGNRVLFGKRLKNRGLNNWHFPGGHLENGESFEQTAIRESKEETNVDIKNPRFVAITNDIYDDGHHMITIFMIADYLSGDVYDMEPDKAEAWSWYKWDELPQPYFLPVENLLKQGYNPFKNNANK